MFIEFWQDIPNYTFLQAALAACVLSSFACGIVGSFITVKRMTYIAAAIAHCVLGGMGAARYFQTVHDIQAATPMRGAVAAAVLAAIVTGAVTLYGKERVDTVLGVMWALGMALGISFIMKTPGYNEDLMSYLFGNILMVSQSDLLLMLTLDFLVVGITLLFYKKFLTILFSEEFARLRGIRVEPYYFCLMILIALSVVLLVQVVGIVMVIALMTLPAATAAVFTNRLHTLIMLSVGLCLLFTTGGLSLSYEPNLPAGATIIELAAATYLLVIIGRSVYFRFLKGKFGKGETAEYEA